MGAEIFSNCIWAWQWKINNHFNLNSEVILREIMDTPGIKVGGVNIIDLMYADIAENEENLQKILEKSSSRQRHERTEYKYNNAGISKGRYSKKSVALRFSRTINAKSIQEVENFPYFVSLITSETNSHFSRCFSKT